LPFCDQQGDGVGKYVLSRQKSTPLAIPRSTIEAKNNHFQLTQSSHNLLLLLPSSFSCLTPLPLDEKIPVIPLARPVRAAVAPKLGVVPRVPQGPTPGDAVEVVDGPGRGGRDLPRREGCLVGDQVAPGEGEVQVVGPDFVACAGEGERLASWAKGERGGGGFGEKREAYVSGFL
jgi:hypothetical protein